MLVNYVVIDLEMTGLSSFRDKIIEIGAVKVRDGAVSDVFQELVNPNVQIEEKIVELTGITQDMVADKPYVGTILQDFLHFAGENPIIGHNLKFDYSFLMQAGYDNNCLACTNRKWYGIDTLKLARKFLDKDCSKTLEALGKQFGIKDDKHHRALNDAMVTRELYEILCRQYEKEGECFEPEELHYKPKKDRKPSVRELRYAEQLMERLGVKSEVDIYQMMQSELSRYANRLEIELRKRL